MEQRLSFLTLGVKDLEKMKRFYKEVFGWKPLKEMDEIVFFRLNGFIFGLFPWEELAKDAGVEPMEPGGKSFTMAMNYNSEQEVDAVVEDLRQKGVKILLEPERVVWGGYRGYVEDIENNIWEIAYNPFIEMDQEGSIITHK